MKKITIPVFVCAIFISLTVHAQEARIGFSAGAVLAQVKTKADNETHRSNSRLGFNIAVNGDVPIAGNFSFQPALIFLQKGGKESEDVIGIAVKNTISINYLELPLNLIYRSPGNKAHFITGLGPSLSYALSGTVKVEQDGQSQTVKIKFGNGSDNELKKFELGGNLLAGCEFNNGLFIALNYNIGFSNISTDSNSKWKNNYFGLRLGYFIGGNK